MQGILSYSGMSAKVRAMSGGLIKKEEYEEMSQLRTVSEVAAYLNRFQSYQNLFKVSAGGIRRSSMEDSLTFSVFRDFHKIYMFAGTAQRKFLDIYYLRFENTRLKRYLRNIFDGRSQDPYGYQEDIAFFQKHSALDIQLLSQARSAEAFREALKNTVFYPILKTLDESGKTSLFEYENAINLYFLKKMFTEYKKILKNQDLEAIYEIYGMEIDLLNLQWIYRAKRYYRLKPDDIRSILIPIHYKLKEDAVRLFIDAPGTEEILSLLKQTYYARYIDEEINTISIETLYRKVIGKIRSLYILKYPYSAACMENYLARKEEEVDKLTTLLEGVRFGIGPQEIRRYIE